MPSAVMGVGWPVVRMRVKADSWRLQTLASLSPKFSTLTAEASVYHRDHRDLFLRPPPHARHVEARDPAQD